MRTVYNKPGVYCLKCVTTKNIYIGGSGNLKKRKNNHITDLRYNRSDIKQLQEDWNNGHEVTFEILEFTDLVEERENYWIGFYKIAGIFNCLNVFQSVRERSHIPDSFRKTMSSVLKKRWENPEYRSKTTEMLKAARLSRKPGSPNSKITIIEYKDGKIEEYRSAKEAAESLGLLAGTVVSHYIGKRKLFKDIKIYYKGSC